MEIAEEVTIVVVSGIVGLKLMEMVGFSVCVGWFLGFNFSLSFGF